MHCMEGGRKPEYNDKYSNGGVTWTSKGDNVILEETQRKINVTREIVRTKSKYKETDLTLRCTSLRSIREIYYRLSPPINLCTARPVHFPPQRPSSTCPLPFFDTVQGEKRKKVKEDGQRILSRAHFALSPPSGSSTFGRKSRRKEKG
jgi:hypothetical protein